MTFGPLAPGPDPAVAVAETAPILTRPENPTGAPALKVTRLRDGKATEAVELRRWLLPESSRSTVTLAQLTEQPVPIDRSDPLTVGRSVRKLTETLAGPVAVAAKYGRRSSSPTGSEPMGWHAQQERADAWARAVPEPRPIVSAGAALMVALAALDGPSWSVSGGAVPESLSASASARTGSQDDPRPSSEQPDRRPARRLTSLVPLRARPLALRTKPESMPPLT